MLTHRDAVSFLLEHKLIQAESFVMGNLIVEEASRRNHNYKIISEKGPSFLLKQEIGREANTTLAREAVAYELLQSDSGKDGFARFLPQYYGYDPQNRILILELAPDSQDLGRYYARRGRFSITLATLLGEALGTLHRLKVVDRQKFAQLPPWALSAYYLSPDFLQTMSNANLKLIEIIQHSAELCQLLDELRQEWRAERLIHYDIKWDNCIVAAQSASKRKPTFKIIDWELAGVGDPCWDVGSVFSSYLSFWVLSIPITGDSPPDRFMELARYPLELMQPAIRAFWREYVRRKGLDATSAEHFLLQTVKYAAARLVQTAFEQTQTAMYLNGNIVCLLQLSLNILQHPREAIVHLLNVPLEHVRFA